MLDENTLERIRKEYPKGTRIKLIRMDDCKAPPCGTLGTVLAVDDIGSLIIRWDNGSGLHLLYGIDEYEKIETKEQSDARV